MDDRAAADFRERMAPALDFGNGVREGVQSFLRARAKTHRERGSALHLVMREMAEGSPRLRGALRQSDVAENYRVVEHALVEAQRRGLIRAQVDCRAAAHLLIMSSSPLFGYSRRLGQANGADEEHFAASMADMLAGGLAASFGAVRLWRRETRGILAHLPATGRIVSRDIPAGGSTCSEGPRYTIAFTSGLWLALCASTVARAVVIAVFLPGLREMRLVRPISPTALAIRVIRANVLAEWLFELLPARRRRPKNGKREGEGQDLKQ